MTKTAIAEEIAKLLLTIGHYQRLIAFRIALYAHSLSNLLSKSNRFLSKVLGGTLN